MLLFYTNDNLFCFAKGQIGHDTDLLKLDAEKRKLPGNCFNLEVDHYKKTSLLQGKFAREKFPRKFETYLQRNCKKSYHPRKSLVNLQGKHFSRNSLANLQEICEENVSLANLQEICKGSYSVLANPLQICKIKILSQICKGFARTLYVYLVFL